MNHELDLTGDDRTGKTRRIMIQELNRISYLMLYMLFSFLFRETLVSRLTSVAIERKENEPPAEIEAGKDNKCHFFNRWWSCTMVLVRSWSLFQPFIKSVLVVCEATVTWHHDIDHRQRFGDVGIFGRGRHWHEIQVAESLVLSFLTRKHSCCRDLGVVFDDVIVETRWETI